MKITILSILLIYSSIINAAESDDWLCIERPTSPLENMFHILENYQTKRPSPDMSFSYTLAADCSFSVVSTLEFPSISDFDLFTNKITDAKVNLASADRTKVVDVKITKQGANYKQVLTAKKLGIKAEVISNCAFTDKTSSSFNYNCKIDAEESKTKGLVTVRLFEEGATNISCKMSTTVKCTVKTTGKAKSVLVQSSCDLAEAGAEETLESTYRLAHYITHGNTNNIQAGKALVEKFANQAKNHKSIGKSTFKISGIL